MFDAELLEEGQGVIGQVPQALGELESKHLAARGLRGQRLGRGETGGALKELASGRHLF